jgi:hypothetical protein
MAETVGGLTKRVPGAESDIMLLRWWQHMVENGELLEVFGECVATPSGFLNVFADPRTTLYYSTDEHGVCIALWYEPFMGNTALGMWAREDWRKRRWWDALVATLADQFQQFQLVMAMTRNRNLIIAGPEMGWTVLGTVPYLYRGDTCTLLYLTREAFVAQHGALEDISGKSSG